MIVHGSSLLPKSHNKQWILYKSLWNLKETSLYYAQCKSGLHLNFKMLYCLTYIYKTIKYVQYIPFAF